MLGGLDLGTTGCKIVIYDNNGNQIYRTYKDYPTSHKDGKDELNLDDIFNSVKFVLKDSLLKFPELEALAIDTFGEAFVLLDKDDKSLTPIVTCTDARGADEVKKLVNALGEEKIEKITGLKPALTYSYSKLAWFKNNEPSIFKKATHFLMMEDALVYLLTGNNVLDYSLATRSMMFDVNTLSWSDEILSIEGFDKNIMSKLAPFGTICGELKASFLEEFGVKNNIKIVLGGHDQVAVAIGSGVFECNHATDGAGTVECISAIYDNNIDQLKLITNNYAYIPFFDKNITYAFSYTSGSLIDWFLKGILNENNPDIFNELEKKFSNKPSGILVLPHFAGAATPYMDADAKGAFVGLSLATTKAQMYQAILEGIAYEMRLNVEMLNKAGIVIQDLTASGGGSNSRKWLQIKADILNLPILTLEGKECGTRGCAMICAVSLNKLNSFDEARKIYIKYKDKIIPNYENHILYSKQYTKYAKLYNALKGVSNE